MAMKGELRVVKQMAVTIVLTKKCVQNEKQIAVNALDTRLESQDANYESRQNVGII